MQWTSEYSLCTGDAAAEILRSLFNKTSPMSRTWNTGTKTRNAGAALFNKVLKLYQLWYQSLQHAKLALAGEGKVSP